MHKKIAFITIVFCMFFLSCAHDGRRAGQHYIPLNKYASRAEALIAEGDYAQALEVLNCGLVQSNGDLLFQPLGIWIALSLR